MKIIWDDISTKPKIEFEHNEKGLFTMLIVGSDGSYLHYWQQNISNTNPGQAVDSYLPPKCSDSVTDSCTILVYSQNGKIRYPILFIAKPTLDIAKSRFSPQDLILSKVYRFGGKELGC